MKPLLDIVGRGAVSPAGSGLESLRSGSAVPVAVPFLGQPEQGAPVLRVDPALPALARWKAEPRLRRASPISLFLIEAAEQALAEAGLDANSEMRRRTGLVAAFSLGPLGPSRRFYQEILAKGPKGANPALFPETVFNSPVSHVAAALKLGGAAYALVGDATAWIAALRTARLWLEREEPGLDRVLVLGAEEFDPIALDATRAAGWLRRSSFVPSEGAAAVVVARPGSKSESGPRLGALAAWRDGFLFRSPAQARVAAERCFIEGEAPFLPTASRTWLACEEARLAERRPALAQTGPFLGEATTASAAWNTLRAVDRLGETPRLLLPVWGLTHQLGALELIR